MDTSSLSLILTVLVGWWLFTVALATGGFKVTRHPPHRHDEERRHQIRPENRHTRAQRWLQVGITLPLCVTLLGCLGVTPLPKRVKGQSGLIEKPFDLSFILAGQTLRSEVEEKLKHFDVGLQSQSFFMARWSTASAAIIAETLSGSSSQRIWHYRNLLVEFNGAGMVKNYAVFSDDELISHLTTVLVSQPPLDLSHPLEIDAQLGPEPYGAGASGKLILTPGMFTFKEEGTRKKPHRFQVAVEKIARMDCPNLSRDDPVHTLLLIQLHKKVEAVPSGGLIVGRHRRIYLYLTVPGLVTILEFLEQSRQPA
jgi:hypothetical protein